MLALHRSRCLLHSPLFLQIRTLRTLPREIPRYVKRWDPTLKSRQTPAKRRSEPPSQEPTLLDLKRKSERVALRDAQKITVATRTEQHGPEEREILEKLNVLLVTTSSNTNQSVALSDSLWQAYTSAKSADSDLLSRVPSRVWDLLWVSQSNQGLEDHTSRLNELERDMSSVGRSSNISGRARYLELRFFEGKEQEALAEWEDDHVATGNDDRQDYKPEHLELGAKLYALTGNPDRARDIMNELFDLYPKWDTSIMLTVFRAHTNSQEWWHHKAAMAMYSNMKERRGSDFTIDDRDVCFVGFLEARNLRYAKKVFRDMIEDGTLAATGASDHINEVLTRLHMLYRLGTDISKMTSIALDAISVLPPAYHGHLFGDWMKLAVVQSAPEAAAQILDMMYLRGYKPETFHFNMLLRALLRTKEKPHILKAENIGWHMIDKARDVNAESKLREEMSDSELHDSPATTARNVPVADVTTYGLLMHHHAKSLQWEYVDYLTRQLKQESVTPNATIMNVLMDNKCRQGAYAEAWSIYKTLTEPAEGNDNPGVFPNGASFRCLWKILRFALGGHTTRDDINLPTPRNLLKEMIEWGAKYHSRYDAARFKLGLAAADQGAITSLILHCFSYTQDLAGSLIALHVLRHKFHILPTEKAAEILKRQMAWVEMKRENETVRSQYFHSRSNMRNTATIERVYNLLLQRRLQRLDISPEQYALLTDEQIGDIGLDLLSEFVRVVLKRTYPPEVVEAMIEAAKLAVEMPELPTGDMDAFEVA